MMQREGNLNNFGCLAERNKTEGNKISILFGYGGGTLLWSLRFRGGKSTYCWVSVLRETKPIFFVGCVTKGNKTNMPLGYWGERSEGEGKPISIHTLTVLATELTSMSCS